MDLHRQGKVTLVEVVRVSKASSPPTAEDKALVQELLARDTPLLRRLHTREAKRRDLGVSHNIGDPNDDSTWPGQIVLNDVPSEATTAEREEVMRAAGSYGWRGLMWTKDGTALLGARSP